MRNMIRAVVMLVVLVALLFNGAPSVKAYGYGTYVVQVGDTLFSIASRFNVSVSELATINGVYDVNVVYVGQVLLLPPPLPGGNPNPNPNPGTIPPGGGGTPPVIVTYPPGTIITVTTTTTKYVVKRGDTLDAIAVRFRVTTHALMQVNGLANPNLIYVGQLLTIPQQSVTVKPPQGTVSGPKGRVYVVQVGDTLSSIAAKFKRDPYAIAKANGILNLNFVYSGQVLVIP